jgi:hypothetical protein
MDLHTALCAFVNFSPSVALVKGVNVSVGVPSGRLEQRQEVWVRCG